MLLFDSSAFILAMIAALLIFNFTYTSYLIFITLLLIFLFYNFLNYAKKHMENLGNHRFEEVNNTDLKSLWSISMIILPLTQHAFDVIPPTIIILILTILLVFYYKTDTIIYNFLFILIGYHYFTVKIHGQEYILISKRKRITPENNIQICKLTSRLILEEQ